MKNKTIITSLACFLFMSIIFYSCTSEPIDSTDEFIEINKAFSETFNTEDAEAMANLYTSTAKIYPPNANVVEGYEAIKGFWAHAKEMGIKTGLFETVKAESIGNITVEEGRYKLFAEGDFLIDQGKYIVTWKKEDGQWKLHNDIFNTSMPAPNPQASANDTVWIVRTYVKADKALQFEDFNSKYLGPAGAEYDQRLTTTVRILKPVDQNKDGTYTYIYIMDPVLNSVSYDIKTILSSKYGEEEASEYMKIYTDCLKDGKQELLVTVQGTW